LQNNLECWRKWKPELDDIIQEYTDIYTENISSASPRNCSLWIFYEISKRHFNCYNIINLAIIIISEHWLALAKSQWNASDSG
jgi:hypothetical protein